MNSPRKISEIARDLSLAELEYCEASAAWSYMQRHDIFPPHGGESGAFDTKKAELRLLNAEKAIVRLEQELQAALNSEAEDRFIKVLIGIQHR